MASWKSTGDIGLVFGFVWNNRGLLTIFALLFVLLAGCGAKSVVRTTPMASGDCRELWEALEGAIHDAKVADTAVVRVRGFPYLRSTRYLQALSSRAVNPADQHFVLEEMRQLDLEKRGLEISRLSAEQLQDLVGQQGGMAPGFLGQTLSACSQEFLAADEKRSSFFAQVQEGIELDRNYSLWLRSIGLYPLTSLLVDSAAKDAQDEMVARLHRPFAAKGGVDLLTFRPPSPPVSANIAELLGRNRHRPLLSFRLPNQDLLALVHNFAPLLTINPSADHDRFGRIVRTKEGFSVDESDPVVYYYLSQAFVQGLPALQINYVIWFSERTAPASWFEQGMFDGIVFRVTLSWDGQPAFVDVAQQCGCFHFVLFNGSLVEERPGPAVGFRPTVAGKMPELTGDARFHFGILPGRHQVGKVRASVAGKEGQTYTLRPYEELEYFRDGKRIVSLFNSKGRVPGSNRWERFFLFGMGIPKVGAMRQRGHQPITLVGRAYFDDPLLFDKAFGYHLPLPDRHALQSVGADRVGEVDDEKEGKVGK